jgi:predicted transcriptional regulator YheO
MAQAKRRARRLPDHDADRRLKALAEIVGPLARSLGTHCEIVLHDYRIPDHSVVAVAGKVTSRKVGSAMSEIGLSVLAEGDAATDRLNYLTKAPNGRVINSSTIVLRDGKRQVFGALCINMDVTELRQASAILGSLIGDFAQPKPTTFTDDIRDVIDVAVQEELRGRLPASLSREDRLEITRALDARGIFNIKRGMGQVAAALGVSRATAYACLQIVRSDVAERPAADAPANDRLVRRRVG